MQNKVNFDTSNKPFSEIIGNAKKYMVPKYQRDYSWDEEQWSELWEDILAIHNQSPEEREEHYMGYLVLQKEGINEFKIIDGQQRITTLSLLILAALQILKKSEDHERIALIESSYISNKSPSSLTKSYKVELNRNNDEYYCNDLANLSLNPRKRGIKNTEHKMRKAKEFYEAEIKKLKFDGQELGAFIESIISNYLLFTVITVGDDVNAYKVFETLNAIGVQLSAPDLVKNHLFSIIDPKYENSKVIQDQEEKWSITLDNLGKEDFTKFLRCFWNSRNSLANKTNLFKKVKTICTTKESAIGLLDDLREASPIYAALQKHTDEQWSNISNEKHRARIKNCLLALDAFNIVLPHPVLLSAYFAYSEKDFSRVCQWMHVFCIRYHAICNLPSNETEKFYNKISIAIHEGQSANDTKNEIKKRLPDDVVFKDRFSTKSFSTAINNKEVHYLLASLENHTNRTHTIPLQGDYSIEHVLPKGDSEIDSYWRSQFGDQLEQYVSRLGNLALLKSKENRDAGRLSFPDKREIYRKTGLKLLTKLCEYEDWNPENVNQYQSYLADLAVRTWSID